MEYVTTSEGCSLGVKCVHGEMEISNTQKIRVLELENNKVSIQKWWRADSNGDWCIGKGFQLTKQ